MSPEMQRPARSGGKERPVCLSVCASLPRRKLDVKVSKSERVERERGGDAYVQVTIPGFRSIGTSQGTFALHKHLSRVHLPDFDGAAVVKRIPWTFLQILVGTGFQAVGVALVTSEAGGDAGQQQHHEAADQYVLRQPCHSLP